MWPSLIGVLVGAAVAVLIGLPALRIPGLYLAVTTLAFAVFVSVWLVAQGTFLDTSGLLPTLAKPDAGIVDFSSRRSVLLPVPGVPARVRGAGRAAAAHRHRSFGDRGARQPDVGRGHDHLDRRA